MFKYLSSPIACALIAAAGLHAGLWWAWPRAGVAGGHDAWVPVTAEVASGDAHVARMVVRAASPADGRAAQSEVDSLPMRADGRAGEERSSPAATDTGGPAWLAASYLEANQVDRSPRPVYGWLLDEDVLIALGRTHLRIKLWVSAEGRIDHAEVLQAEPPGEWVGRTMRLLHGTPMEPAVQDGVPVAATTVVELQTENEQVR